MKMSNRGIAASYRGGSRGRGRGRLAPGSRPVTESTRIDISAQIEAFQRSDETGTDMCTNTSLIGNNLCAYHPTAELTFPPNLSNHDRAVVHAECRKYGFHSKSSGKGEARKVTIFRKRQKMIQEDDIYNITVNKRTSHVLSSYMNACPPTEDELMAAAGSARHDVVLQDAYGAGIAHGSSSEDEEDVAILAETSTEKKSKKRRNPTPSSAGAAHFSAEDIQKRCRKWQERLQTTSVAALQKTRAGLPIATYRDEIIHAVQNNQVVMIAGETGCGKTTQVPQYLLEDAWTHGRGIRALCTQPRRISAISVAERVAAERGEKVGDAVGYSIRLDTKGGPNCSLMFATNGIVLRMLTSSHNDEALAGITHLMVDEIHERDRFADFLLIIVRDILPTRPNLRVILMSATLHIDLFSRYFSGCPVIQVPGFTHPVEDFYLEEILKLTGYQDSAVAELSAQGVSSSSIVPRHPGRPVASMPREDIQQVESAIENAFTRGSHEDFELLLELTGAAGTDEMADSAPSINVVHPVTGITALMSAAAHGRIDVIISLLANGADTSIKATNGFTATDIAQQFGQSEAAEVLEEIEVQALASDDVANVALALSHYQSNVDVDEVDLQLIKSLLDFICVKSGSEGDTTGDAILIFLPGWDEITRLKELLESSPEFSNSKKFQVLPLHSLVAPSEQRRVFVRPPTGVRKIVLATNIAETSITIDDVVFVIDAGRLKEKSFDPYTGVSTLQSAWISKASERQRRGRAGRCRPGFAFHLYSRARSAALQEFQLPEIQRSPLDEMGLQVKLLEKPGDSIGIASFLSKAVEPPIPQAVTVAIQLLKDIGALNDQEHLTSLGRHLAALPLPPTLGKLLLYGVLFNCLDPVLTVACFLAYRDPWVLPAGPDGRRAATILKARFAASCGGASDHLAALHAYDQWTKAQSQGWDRSFCLRNFLSPATMNMVCGMRRQLLDELTARGFVRSLESASKHAHRIDLVRAVLACGFYPSMGSVIPSHPNQKEARSASLMTKKDDKIRIHPSSIVCKPSLEQSRSDYETRNVTCGFYDEITRGDSITSIKVVTLVSLHPFLLVAANVHIISDDDMDVDDGGERREEGPPTAILVLDGWLKMRISFADVAPLMVLRLRLAKAFAYKVRHPHKSLPDALYKCVQTVSDVFRSEALTFSDSSHTQDTGSPKKSRPACRFFAQGHCREGVRCRYSHHNAVERGSDVVSSEKHGVKRSRSKAHFSKRK